MCKYLISPHFELVSLVARTLEEVKEWRRECRSGMVSHWNASAPKRNHICATQLSLACLGIQTLPMSFWNQGGPRDCNISRAVGFGPLLTTVTIKTISKKSSEYCHEIIVQINIKLPSFADWTIQGLEQEEYLTSVNSHDNFEPMSGIFCSKCCLQKTKLTLMIFIGSTGHETKKQTKQNKRLHGSPSKKGRRRHIGYFRHI